MGSLNDKQVKALLKKGTPGRFAVGGGLYFRVSQEGTGFWVVRYMIHGKRREHSLGRYGGGPGEMPLVEASAKAAQIKADVKKGVDPISEKKRPSSIRIETVNHLAEDWLTTDIEKRLKHPNIPRRVYKKDLAPLFGELKISRVTPMDIRAAIDRLVKDGRPSIANDALMYSKQLFRHAIRLNLITYNPAEAFTVHHAGGIEKSRSRYLTLKEIEIVFRVFRENPVQFTRENYLAIALLLSTGVRKGELIAARWDEFDFDKSIWHLPDHRSKTGVAIAIPLAPEVMVWLEELKIRACGSNYLFPSRRVSKRREYISDDTLNHALAKLFGMKVQPGLNPENKMGAAGIEHFTIHDLRRTCRSLLAAAGVPGHIAERCLNHKLKGVEGIYDRYDYLDERREALAGIAKTIMTLTI